MIKNTVDPINSMQESGTADYFPLSSYSGNIDSRRYQGEVIVGYYRNGLQVSAFNNISFRSNNSTDKRVPGTGLYLIPVSHWHKGLRFNLILRFPEATIFW